MILRLLPTLLVLAAAPACKKKSSKLEGLHARFAEFTDRICSCKDKACADKVHDDMTAWSKDVSAQVKRENPSEAEMKRLEAVGRRYAECTSKLYAATGQVPTAAPPAIGMTDEKITNADRLIKLTYDELGLGYRVSKLRLAYVRADGTLDPQYGEVDIELGKPEPPEPADDPDRPIGAPVPAAAPTYDMMARCPAYRWKAGVRTNRETSCLMFGDGIARPKCSVREVWKRAIDKGAPEKALAVLQLSGPPMQSWKLSIDDDPRDIHFSIDVEDTCEPTLEAPR